ncbi:MAG: hypothetical protein PVH88_14845 [Ignavibacteria bacterium]|jgi:hypothetical protein
MKKFLIILFCLPILVNAQNINGRFSSAVYTFERFQDADNSETYLRTFQSLYLNFNKDKISVRTRVNFETDIANTLDNDPRLRFYNLYLEARDIAKIATIKLGRQPLYYSVLGGIFDGASLKLKHSGISLTGFYGGNVPAYQKLEFTDDLSNDYVLGAKLEILSVKNFKFAAGYIDKNFKTHEYTATRLDEDLNPIQVLIEQNSNQYRFIRGEASYFKAGIVSISTRYDYDINFETTSKFEFSGRYEQLENIDFSVYYNYREPRIRYNSIFSVFNYRNTQEIEAGVDFKINKQINLTGKFGNVTYEDDDSQRFTVGVNTHLGSVSYRKTFGYAGELDAISVYTARSFMDGMLTPSVGVAYTTYKLDPDAESQNLTTILGGVNLRPFDKWSFDIQGQFLNNKIYSNDFRVLLKINHWFNTNF